MITSGLRLLSRPRVCKVAKEHSHVGSWKPGGARRRRSLGLTAHEDKVVSASRHTETNSVLTLRHTRPMRFGPVARKDASTGLVALRIMFVLAPCATGRNKPPRLRRRFGFWPCGTQGRFYWSCGTQDHVR